MKLYIVYELLNSRLEHSEEEYELHPFIVGIFSKKSLAKAIIKDLRFKNKDKYEYIIDDYALNNIYFKTQEEVDRELSESIEEMVRYGLMDYKIGEDGVFYFELTDKGKEELK